jgi:tetrahedral aminopeptidase
MHTDQFDFLRALVEATGPSGYEWDAQRVWRERVVEVAADTWTDSLGNAFATLNPGGSPRVMIEAHIDQIGFIVTYFDEQGFVYFKPIGHFDPATVVGTRVRLMGRHGPVEGAIGRMPVHLLEPEAQDKGPELKSLWIDVGASSRAEVEERLAVGDAGAWSAGMTRLLGSCIAAPGLDNRAGAYVIAEAFRALADAHPHAEVIAASSVQEEIGLRGAQVSAYTADAPIGICSEVHWTSDHPYAPVTELGEIRVGAGPLLTRGANTNHRVFERLAAAAQTVGTPYQVRAEPKGTSNDQNVMQIARGGMATGLVKVPTRYLHTTSEIVSTDDMDACVAVLTRFVLDLEPDFDPRPL